MWVIPPGLKVYLALGITDMRKSVNGLSLLITDILDQDPFSGHLFAFCNRRKTILKILYWDRNGFCLWYKRLEKDVFRWPRQESELLEIGHRELMWLLEGLDLKQARAYKPLKDMIIS